MNDFSETRTPNGGWQFLQPQTKWTLDRKSKPSSVSVTLDQAAELLQKHRMQNPQFELNSDFGAVRDEIIIFNRARLGLPPPGQFPNAIPQQRGAAAVVADRVSKTAAGIRLVKQWLGDGLKPVDPVKAQARAAICATCPKNQKGDFLQRLNALAARELKLLMQMKTEFKLATVYDEKLQVCGACDCDLKLKCWAPLNHILNNTSETVRADLDPRCWVLHESQPI